MLKVYGGTFHLAGIVAQQRVIVAASSQKRAAELLDVSLYVIQTYFSVTGNEYELEVALGEPETIFYKANNYSSRFPFSKYKA